ncbi:nucleotidyl transferase AbiEii/AbiGii toxin family protein [Sphingomonas sp. Ant20]|uniref:nucleotidyl transferase AbiEii/AbiGii toxin family protein n=1 Tax=Sphingomonas sp. Ant20 TaxID=104605 RepID=UPI000690247E|nr:nucleotidyl transferase AbiEii/AbiGii toxin family protein [Sphingomonas sp. Ant20]
MSEIDEAPEGERTEIVDVDVRAWVEAAKTDQVRYRDRQVTEIVLAAIGVAPNLKKTLVLKGGAVMALAFKSERVTGDVDFSADADPEAFTELVVEELNALLPKTAITLGYIDLRCRVQSVKKMPKAKNFEEHDFPALLVRIGSAVRGTGEEKWLDIGQASRVLDMEISFRDQVYAFQELTLTDAGVAVRAFTLHELIAEKFRALLQQPIRNRYRRQDVYDIAFLVETNELGDEDRTQILTTLIKKCHTRSINPDIASIDDPEIAKRAQADWDTLKLEISDLPPFEERFAIVRDLYISLPWRHDLGGK